MANLINKDKEQIHEIGIPKKEDDLLRYFTKEELEASAKELAYMKTHLEEYKNYNNMKDLKKDLLSDKML